MVAWLIAVPFVRPLHCGISQRSCDRPDAFPKADSGTIPPGESLKGYCIAIFQKPPCLVPADDYVLCSILGQLQ